eukprot:358752-Chlamydomonas_euryale.AAC.14
MIWETIQNKLDSVGKVLDGRQDSLACASTRALPQPGQANLETYLGQSRGDQGSSPTGACAPLLETQPGALLASQAAPSQQASIDHFFKRKAGSPVPKSPGCEPAAKRARPT